MSIDAPNATQTPQDEVDIDEQERLAGEVAVLEAENERLRNDLARQRQSEHRNAAVGLVALGLVAAVAGILFPTTRTVLFALAGTGLFLGVLTYYLSPEQFLPVQVGRGIYGTLAENERAVIDELGLDDRQLYVPAGEEVRLYVPQHTATDLPDRSALTATFVSGADHRGVSLQPTGQPLFEAVEETLTGELAAEPAELTSQLREALVEHFELLSSSEQSVPSETTADAGELSVGVTDSVYGSVAQFDHPVVSLLGVGLARGLETPVEVSVDDGNDRVDAVVRCQWPPELADQ